MNVVDLNWPYRAAFGPEEMNDGREAVRLYRELFDTTASIQEIADRFVGRYDTREDADSSLIAFMDDVRLSPDDWGYDAVEDSTFAHDFLSDFTIVVRSGKLWLFDIST